MKVTENLVNKVNERLVGYEVKANSVRKNNVEKVGLTIVPSDGLKGVCPTVYIDDLDNINDVIARINNVAKREHPSFDVEEIVSRDFILNHLRACMVSADNVILDDEVVYRPFLDMAVTYRIVFDGFEDGAQGSILIKKDILDRAGLSEVELFEVAKNSSDYEAKTLFDTLNSMMGLDDDFADELSLGMPNIYVLSSKDMIHGASVLITDLIKDFGAKTGREFYILPSSVHEVLLVPCNDSMDVSALHELVVTVNSTEVRPEDRLTDSVYKLDATGLSKVA